MVNFSGIALVDFFDIRFLTLMTSICIYSNKSVNKFVHEKGKMRICWVHDWPNKT